MLISATPESFQIIQGEAKALQEVVSYLDRESF